MKKNGFYQYKTSPFDGKQMGKRWVGKALIAISKKKLDKALADKTPLMVVNRDSKTLEYMEFKGNESPEEMNAFQDKWGDRGMYWLYYYEWKPMKQLEMDLGEEEESYSHALD